MFSSVKVKKTIEIDVPNLGTRIWEKRKLSGKTVEELSAIAGITRQHWYQIEKERFRDGLPLETLRAIEKALSVDFGVNCDD